MDDAAAASGFVDLPALDLVRRAPGSADAAALDTAHVAKIGANAWMLAVAPADGERTGSLAAVLYEAVQPALGADVLPSRVLGRVNAALFDQSLPARRSLTSSCMLARIELDICGAWVTLGSAGGPRPVVVRKAGWVDLRGQPCPSLGATRDANFVDDRVGLGPGDAIVMVAGLREADGQAVSDLLEALLAVAGSPASGLALAAAELAAGAGSDAGCRIVVVQVPDEVEEVRLPRVLAATGLPREAFGAPRYPLGDVDPDVWNRRVLPPREARLRLAPDAQAVPEARSLLRRLLRSWRMGDEAAEQLELLTSEAVTNAVRHTRSRDVILVVSYDGDSVRVEVDDESEALPLLRDPGPDDVSGRGMVIIDALADRWGVDPSENGKRVWFETAVG
ncbi:MAG TPA: ATP-binding protein [Acidimicrobiia bacterium]|nr:ATP-binding protein [Acidimicrobiia bacterium]